MAKNTSTAQSILKEMKNKEFSPIYFLCGDEPFFIDQIAAYAESNILSESERGFNQMVVYGKDTEVKSLIASARRFPMMASHQVIIIKEAQQLKDTAELVAYFNSPVPSTIMIFCWKGGTPDKREKLYKSMDKAVYFESKKLYENQVPGWVDSYLREEGIAANPKAIQLLVDSIGADISRLANELEKIRVNLKPGETLSEKQVSEWVGINRDYNVFELQTALAQLDFQKCIRIVQYFSHSKNQFGKPFLLVATLYSWFLKVFQVHANSHLSDTDLARAIGVNPFFLREYKMASKNFMPQNLEQIFAILQEIDLKSKGVIGGSEDDDSLLKEMMIKLFQQATVR